MIVNLELSMADVRFSICRCQV